MKDKQGKEPESGYESRDINVDRVVAVGLIGVIMLVIILVLINQLFIVTRNKQVQKVVLQPTSIALQQLRTQEDETLKSYKVIDKDKGIYQIPISRAMKIMADSAYQESLKKAGEQNNPPRSP